MFKKPEPKVFSSGYKELDEALGIGGIPRGKIIELSGPDDSLKTMLMLHMLARMQKNDILPAYIDVDRDLSTDYIANSEVDANAFLLLYADNDVDIIDNVRTIVKEKVVDIIIIDSTGFINPAEEKNITTMFRDMLSKLSSIVCGTDTTLFFVNQLRNSLDGTNDKVPMCNKIFDLYASIRLSIKDIDKENDTLCVEVVRNKFRHHLITVMLKLA